MLRYHDGKCFSIKEVIAIQRLKLSHQSVQVGNVTVQYQVIGEGYPVILIHGLSGSMHWWGRNVADLAKYYKVYLLDLPGFGTMRQARSQFALSKTAAWLLAWMEAVGIPKAHFIGHSMGGYICIWIAAHRPEVVSRLILVAPAVLSQIRTVFGYMVPLLITIRYLTPCFFPILVYDALRAGPLILLRATRDLLMQDAHEEIEAIRVPTLLVWGENDTLVPVSIGHILRTQIPNARLLIFNRAGHVAMFDQYQAFNAATEAFLRGEVVGE